MEPGKSRICAEVDTLARDLYAVSEYLYHNPEIGYQDFKACEFLSRFMEERGFKSERGTGGVQTAFLARPAQRPPNVGVMEYWNSGMMGRNGIMEEWNVGILGENKKRAFYDVFSH